MSLMRLLRTLCFATVGWCIACTTAFLPAKFQSNEALYEASLREYRARHWDNAIAGFERLTTQLPARDSLMRLSLHYLGSAHVGKGENLLAAQAFTRLAESFPNDTLADDALLAAGRAFARMWRKPSLDAQYGETALSTLRTMVSLYPSSPLVGDAQREIARLNEWFARKLFETGMHYLRRDAHDSAIIYFKDVARLYPDSPSAREALFRLVEAYRSINYRDDASEVCQTLRQSYPGDRQVVALCATPPAAASATP